MRLLLSPGRRFILYSTLSFSVMNILIKLLHRFSVHQVVFFRALFAFAIAFMMVRSEGLSPFGKNRQLLIIRALIGTTGLYLFIYSLKELPLATAVTLQYTAPLFGMIISAVILKENATSRIWIFSILAFLGIALTERADSRFDAGDISIALFSAACSGIVQNLIRRLRKDDHPLVVTLYFPLLTIPISFYPMLETWQNPTPTEWGLFIAIGIAAQSAQYFMTKAFVMEPIGNSIVVSYLATPLAALLGFFVFQETLSTTALIGLIIVICSVILGTLDQKFFQDLKFRLGRKSS